MKKLAKVLFFAVLLMPLTSLTVSASGGASLEHSGANINDTASLQRGAKWYMNYCMGCHSIAYMRFNRMAEDLELSEEMVMENLVFSFLYMRKTHQLFMLLEILMSGRKRIC